MFALAVVSAVVVASSGCFFSFFDQGGSVPFLPGKGAGRGWSDGGAREGVAAADSVPAFAAPTTSTVSATTTATNGARTAAVAKSSTVDPATAASELDWIKDCETGIGLVVAFSSANNCTTQSPHGRIMTAVGRFHPASAPGGNRQPPGGRDQASNLVIMAIDLLRDAGGGGRTLVRSDFPNWEKNFSAMGLTQSPTRWRSDSTMETHEDETANTIRLGRQPWR